MPRLTPGFEPWRPLFVAKLPELEELLRADLGPIRARGVTMGLVEVDGAPTLTVDLESGDPDRHATTLIVEAALLPIVGLVPGMRLAVGYIERPKLRLVR